MRILHVTSELFPYSKTGGLADMVAGLTGALAEQGHEITIATPLYRGIREQFPELQPPGRGFKISLGKNTFTGRWSRMGVLISPGEMTVARMPLTDSSRSTIFVNTDMPCLEAL